MARAAATFLSHGGGPMPLLGDPGHARLVSYLKEWPLAMAEPPKALVLFSAHWEEREPTVIASEHPPLLFDYSGFPPETYKYSYPAPGSPELAERVRGLLEGAGVVARATTARGWDHGVFVPLMLSFPEATTPIVQVSLLASADPKQHWELGRALRPLRDEGIAIVGSGSSYHNMRGFFGQLPDVAQASAAFDAWVCGAVAEPAGRQERVMGWEGAPSARECHPPRAEEHLLPLFVVAGAAHDDEEGVRAFGEADFMGAGVTMSAWDFRPSAAAR